jgi:hypothetical protein
MVFSASLFFLGNSCFHVLEDIPIAIAVDSKTDISALGSKASMSRGEDAWSV